MGNEEYRIPKNVVVLGLKNNYVACLMTELINCKTEGGSVFRALMAQLGMALAMEALRDMPTRSKQVLDRMGYAINGRESSKTIGLIPVATAGDHLVPGVQALLPDASHHSIVIQRDENTAEPIYSMDKFEPALPVDWGLVLEPMLATGGSAIDALTRAKKWGVKKLTLLSCMGAPEGLDKIFEDHPDVKVIVAALGGKLNSHSYIIEPGIGDAGNLGNGLKFA